LPISAIHQINVTYQPEEDRILLRISTSDDSEVQFWLTRRLVRKLLEELAPEMPRVKPPDTPRAVRLPVAVARVEDTVMGHAAADPSPWSVPSTARPLPDAGAFASVSLPYEERKRHHPLGPHPVLILGYQLEAAASVVAIQFQMHGQHRLRLALAAEQVHALLALLGNIAQHAGWGLPPVLPAPVVPGIMPGSMQIH
jgi:hypothetical protein